MLLLDVIIIAVLVIAFLKPKTRQKGGFKPNFARKANELKPNFPYVTQAGLLTPTEQQFWRVLVSACGDAYLLACKTRVADVLDTQPFDRIAFNRVSQMHFDFVLCAKSTTRPLLVVELDDRSHASASAQGRDGVKDAACRAAGLPILRVPVQAQYDAAYLQKRIAETISPPALDTRPNLKV